MSLAEYKSELVQTITCELSSLKRGNLKCANEILKYRTEAQLRVFMVECLLQQDDYSQELVNYLYEQVKVLTRMIVTNKCITVKC